jgi:signal transduction histidine kinase
MKPNFLNRFMKKLISEGAEKIGGKFELKSQPGKGTRVRVKVPLASTGRPTGSP